MPRSFRFALSLACACALVLGPGGLLQPFGLPAQTRSPAPRIANSDPVADAPFDPEAAAIFTMLNKQATDWNRGDLDAFAGGYKDSPEILFMGSRIVRGYAAMLAHYKAHYPTHESMGTLSFTQLEAQGLDSRFATATGRFHLERTPDNGGAADGYFLLVLERTARGWKIVRDDTTSLAPQ